MDVCTLNNHCLHPLSNNLSKKANKTLFLLCNFYMDLLKFDTLEHVSTFMDARVFNHLQPYIYLPTRVSYKSTTLIENMFCNVPTALVKTKMSGKI